MQNHYVAYDAALILVVIQCSSLLLSPRVVALTQRHSEGSPGARAGFHAGSGARP